VLLLIILFVEKLDYHGSSSGHGAKSASKQLKKPKVEEVYVLLI
jgi:hypothetical protein